MNKSRIVLVVALVLFVGSFFVTAVNDAAGSSSATGIPGYLCAYFTLIFPWTREGLRSLQEHPLMYIAMLVSGWINPLFLITIFLLVKKSTRHLGETLRIVLFLMFPACWIILFEVRMRAHVGYFLWSAAMVLAVFSDLFSRENVVQEASGQL